MFDSAGNLYGTTHYGGAAGHGTVFKLIPSTAGWIEDVIWYFSGSNSGYYPNAGLIFDPSGNIYGTTAGGNGSVFELTPDGDQWAPLQVYSFTGSTDGAIPEAALTMDASGDLYGTTIAGGANSMGTVFELTSIRSGTYNFSVMHAFTSAEGRSYYGVTLDSSGDVLGVADDGTTSIPGEIFKLVKAGSSWSFGTVHIFNGSDGYQPNTLIMDSSGNFYGVTNYGDVAGCINNSGCGTIFKLVPEPAAKN